MDTSINSSLALLQPFAGLQLPASAMTANAMASDAMAGDAMASDAISGDAIVNNAITSDVITANHTSYVSATPQTTHEDVSTIVTWRDVRAELSWALPCHTYGLACLFFMLSFYTFISLLNLR